MAKPPIAEVAEGESPNSAKLRTSAAKLRTTARYLFWMSGLWAAFMGLGIVGNVLLIILNKPAGEDLSSTIQNGTYNIIFGAINLLICAGAYQMSRTRNYAVSVTTCLVSCIPCMSPWLLLGIPFGIRALVLLRNPDVKRAFSTRDGQPRDSTFASKRMFHKICLVIGGILVWIVVFNGIGGGVAFLLAVTGLELQPFFQPVFAISHCLGILAGWYIAKLGWPKARDRDVVVDELPNEPS